MQAFSWSGVQGWTDGDGRELPNRGGIAHAAEANKQGNAGKSRQKNDGHLLGRCQGFG
jgi:hypothetical protein